MIFTQHYDSPLGGILLAADETGLRGLWFDGQKYFARSLPAEHIEQDTPALTEAKRWLDILPEKSRTSLPRCTPQAPRSAKAYGKFF